MCQWAHGIHVNAHTHQLVCKNTPYTHAYGGGIENRHMLANDLIAKFQSKFSFCHEPG